MPAPTIGALPTPPSRNNAPDVFASNADAFLGAFPNLRTDINALVAYLNSTAMVLGQFQDGTAALPSIRFETDPDTGFYRIAANTLGVSAGGVQRARLSATALQLDVPLTGTAVTQSATDATAGRMLKVGDFGLGTETPPLCTDFNDTGMRNGWYRTEGNGATANTSGLPQEWGVLFVVRGTARITQIWYNDNTASLVGTVFRRMWDGGSSSWTPWYRMLDGRSAVGAITRHSDGAATGPIIERGSNANGGYLRLADGTQICSRTITASSSAGVVWTFPAAFSAAPIVTGAAIATVVSTTVMDAAPSTTAVTISTRDNANARRADVVHLIARGVWF